ncbi:MAG: hypothetical protein Q7U86_06645 [Draconibacterium sp.]|nr:hypothetical protein [Draconibacterium sp.]
MNTTNLKIMKMAFMLLILFLAACTSSSKKNANEMKGTISDFGKGTYGYDVAFLAANNVETVELSKNNSEAKVLIAPGYQGRVMTSSAKGGEGTSFGWINYNLIQSGEVSNQFNPFGGEERFWFGPEGGPFSVYFNQGEEQVFENWKVPAVIDTESFDIKNKDNQSVTFTKNTVLKNASGTEFTIGIERKVSLLSRENLTTLFQVDFNSKVLDVVAYQSENTITNLGKNAWTKKGGLLSVWMLSMFSPSASTTVFIPYKTDGQGPVVNDDYFGKVPSDRLIAESGIVYFNTDGKLRSKIGISPQRAKELCGSYDSERKILTLVWGTIPTGQKAYVNSKWGNQDDPFAGDVINSYNDGPVDDGSIMGPFYEIETSSPGAELEPGKSLTHIQKVIHVQGDPVELAVLVKALFGLDLESITSKFSK